jgi:uncharacterized membrane protein required for colicin V production
MQTIKELFTNPSFVFDILCVALLLVLALIYAHKGLVATLVQGFGTLASLIGAKFFADWASPLVFDNFLAGKFASRITDTLTAGGGTVDLPAIVEKYAGFLPQSFVDSVVSAVQASLDGVLATNAAAMAQTIVTEVIAPLVTPVIAIVLFFVAFALLRMIVSLLVTVLTNVNKIPVVGTVNKALGFGVGLLAGAVDLFLLLCGVWALMVVTGGGLPFLNETALANSYFYKFFSVVNPFV